MQRTDVLKLWMDNKQKQTQKCHSNKNDNFIPISKGIFETKPVQLMRFQEKTMNTYLPKQLIEYKDIHTLSYQNSVKAAKITKKPTSHTLSDARARTYPGSVCEQSGTARAFPQQLLCVVDLFLLILFVVILKEAKTTFTSCSPSYLNQIHKKSTTLTLKTQMVKEKVKHHRKHL